MLPTAEGEAPTEWGAGSNGYIYFCCSYLGGPMSQLPHVTPKQVKVARSIKKLLTGRLSSQVSAYPVFPGTEANYLRAQVGVRHEICMVRQGNLPVCAWAFHSVVESFYGKSCMRVSGIKPETACVVDRTADCSATFSQTPNTLHAQIARIAATTVACPAGLFVANEDGGLDKAEEFSPLPAREMGASANWNHRWVGPSGTQDRLEVAS